MIILLRTALNIYEIQIIRSKAFFRIFNMLMQFPHQQPFIILKLPYKTLLIAKIDHGARKFPSPKTKNYFLNKQRKPRI